MKRCGEIEKLGRKERNCLQAHPTLVLLVQRPFEKTCWRDPGDALQTRFRLLAKVFTNVALCDDENFRFLVKTSEKLLFFSGPAWQRASERGGEAPMQLSGAQGKLPGRQPAERARRHAWSLSVVRVPVLGVAPVVARCLTRALVEDDGEVTLVRVADLMRNLGNG